jgi:hypothetical protein
MRAISRSQVLWARRQLRCLDNGIAVVRPQPREKLEALASTPLEGLPWRCVRGRVIRHGNEVRRKRSLNTSASPAPKPVKPKSTKKIKGV